MDKKDILSSKDNEMVDATGSSGIGIIKDGENLLCYLTPSICEYKVVEDCSFVREGMEDIPFTKLEDCEGGGLTLQSARRFISQCLADGEENLSKEDLLHYGTALAWLGAFDKAATILNQAKSSNQSVPDDKKEEIMDAIEHNIQLVSKARLRLPFGPLSRTSQVNINENYFKIQQCKVPGIQAYKGL